MKVFSTRKNPSVTAVTQELFFMRGGATYKPNHYYLYSVIMISVIYLGIFFLIINFHTNRFFIITNLTCQI